MDKEYKLEQVSYDNPKDVRILQACLENWFQNPKDLNLTAPTIKYPFNFNKWVTVSYLKGNTTSFVLKSKNWIIGHMSLQLQPENDFVHLFHVFIDRDYRGKGLSKLLVKKSIGYAKENEIPAVTLYVNQYNQIAIKLYESFGFVDTGNGKPGSLRMRLDLLESNI